MTQIHKELLRALTNELDVEMKVGKKIPHFHGHWAGGPAGEGGVYHEGLKGCTITIVVSAISGMGQCNEIMPDGTQCSELGPVKILQ